MGKKVRLGIIRASHDKTVPRISDAACLAMLMTGEHSVLSYWSNTTRGYLDFVDSMMFPWVEMTMGLDTSREAQAVAAIAALRADNRHHDPLEGLDGLVVLTHPGTGFDGGQTSVGDKLVAVVQSAASDHTFMCHEVGHVLGFDHTYGVINNGADWNRNDSTIIEDPVYGSPYDLMSSASFGTRGLGAGPHYSGQPTFVGPTITDWPNSNAFGMGPHLSRANLHRWMPEALAGRVIDRSFPQSGETVRARVVPASAARGNSLLVLHPNGEPSTGDGRIYVEYRIQAGWDAGIDQFGPSLSRQGVVVHAIVGVAGVGPRVWYIGSVPTGSIDSDVALDTTPLVITVEAFDVDHQWVDLAITTSAPRAVEIELGNKEDEIVGPVGELQTDTTPCGDRIRKGIFATSTSGQFRVRTTGFGGHGEPDVAPPAVAWTVGGVPLPGVTGTIAVPVGGSTFSVDYIVDPSTFELTIASRGGERYDTAVVAAVTGDGQTVTATTTFTVVGWIESIHPDDIAILGGCIGKLAKELNVEPSAFKKPTRDPQYQRRISSIEQEHIWRQHTLELIDRTPTLDVAGRRALQQIVRLQVPH
ncbi:hypothetical protein [Nocardia salmonicida]